jgi:hypothetical protein
LKPNYNTTNGNYLIALTILSLIFIILPVLLHISLNL